MVRIEAAGGTIADALKVFGANLEAADTDMLIEELRHRLASEDEPRVLRILPWAETEGGKRTAAIIAKNKVKRAKQ